MRSLSQAVIGLVDLLVPERCGHCGAATHRSEYGLCEGCRLAIPRLPAARCRRCALPELSDGRARHLDTEGLCEHCSSGPLRPEVYPFGLFSGPVLPAILRRLKYGDERHLARPLSELLWQVAREQLDLREFDAVVPVPLHDKRLLKRGFNQAVLISTALCRHSGLPLLHALERTSATPTQARLGRADRALNLQGSFDVRRGFHPRIEGRRLLLVDDVVTTGSTVAECGRALYSQGTAAVTVICLGRTPRLR